VAAKFDRSAIASAIHRLCDAQAVTVEQESRVRQALERYRTGPADLSDYLILEAAREAQALSVFTFGARFAKSDDASLTAVPATELRSIHCASLFDPFCHQRSVW